MASCDKKYSLDTFILSDEEATSAVISRCRLGTDGETKDNGK